MNFLDATVNVRDSRIYLTLADNEISITGVFDNEERLLEYSGKTVKVGIRPEDITNDEDYVKKNAELCAEADIIVPNITEASFMTGMDYREEYDIDYVKELLQRLNALGAGVSVLTGVSLEKGKTGVMGYERETGEYYVYQNRKIDAAFHGTGDLFSSTFVGEMMRGLNWRDAMRIAADYTAHTIEVTLQNPEKPWYGVDFEATLPELIK
jgi:pyridoxine kinase